VGCRLDENSWVVLGRIQVQMADQLLGDILQIAMQQRQQAESGQDHQCAFCRLEHRDQADRARQFQHARLLGLAPIGSSQRT